MRDLKKFKQDKENGLFAKKMRSGSKGLTTTVIHSAIMRAVRRGRITMATAKNCSNTWDKELVKRPQSLKWSQYASAQLLEVAQYRRQGLLAYARITLTSVKMAISKSRMTVQ